MNLIGRRLARNRKAALWGFVLTAGILAAIYLMATRTPRAIHVNPDLYSDYTGWYIFPDGYPVNVYEAGSRLWCSAPERAPQELLPETETIFFVRGKPQRWVFERGATGGVSHVLWRWKKQAQRGVKQILPPNNPEGTHGYIATTTGGKALEAGLAVLKEGGSAADAAMTVALCQVVHAAGSYVSCAGPMMMVYYDAETSKVYFLDAEYAVPLNETEPQSIPHTGGRTALVPGFMAGVQAAHDRFGRLPFRRLFEPAIHLAEHGELVSPVLEWWIQRKKSVLSRYPETKRIFTRTDGKFYAQGDLFKQRALAETLKQVSAQGAGYIYTGDWARSFVETIRSAGGQMTLEDLRRYRAIWEEPLQTTYHDYIMYTTGATSWGGVNTIEAFNLLEAAEIKRFGPYTRSAASLFWLMQISASQVATHDLPTRQRIKKEHATAVWGQMQQGTWPGLSVRMRKASAAPAHTDGVIVVDQWGNMAVVNHTINTELWGETGLFVKGISIPDSARFQRVELAKAGPGNRLPNGMSPFLLCRNGKPVLGSAAVGGGLHAKTLQVVVNILDFGMDPQSAVDAPAFIGSQPGVVEEDTFEPAVLSGLKAMGLKLRVVAPAQAATLRGYWAGVQIDRATGRMRGGASRGLESGMGGY